MWEKQSLNTASINERELLGRRQATHGSTHIHQLNLNSASLDKSRSCHEDQLGNQLVGASAFISHLASL